MKERVEKNKTSDLSISDKTGRACDAGLEVGRVGCSADSAE